MTQITLSIPDWFLVLFIAGELVLVILKLIEFVLKRRLKRLRRQSGEEV